MWLPCDAENTVSPSCDKHTADTSLKLRKIWKMKKFEQNLLFMKFVLQFKGQSSWPRSRFLYFHPLITEVKWSTPHTPQSGRSICFCFHRLIRLWRWWSRWACVVCDAWGMWVCEQLTWCLSELLHLQFYGCQFLRILNSGKYKIKSFFKYILGALNVSIKLILVSSYTHKHPPIYT